ncbi:MAG: hypothetical protein HN590_04150, partial [Calditrichaeota bacterium]|nr:hypothetical protein [Calditrichota bacterium]
MRTACGNKQLNVVVLHSLLVFAIATFCHSKPITTALLIEPRTTAKYFQAEDLDRRCSELISNWEAFLDPSLFKIEIASDTALPDDLGKFDIVILPGTLCLSDKSLSDIDEYISGGGGLLLTWGTGFRDEDGTWRGAAFIEKQLGIPPKKSRRKINQGFSLRLRDGQPGTMSIDPGYKFNLTSSHTPLYLPKNDVSISAGYWADEEFNPNIMPEDKSQTAFVIHQSESGSRIAWFGCTLDKLEIDESNDKQVKLVFQELLGWLSGGSISSINPWPKGFNASMLIQANFFAEFSKIEHTQDIFDHLGVAATFNILSKTSTENVDAINSINTKRFEIGLLGDKNAPFAGFDIDEQVIRLKNHIDFFDDLHIKPSGFNPALNTYDRNTIEALYKLGIEYLFAADRSNPVVPFNFRENSTDSEIILFPKNELDDLDIKYKLQVSGRDKMIEIMSSEAEKIWDLNGLYKFSFHSDITLSKDLEYIAKKIVKKAESKKHIWIATANDIATWRKQISELTVKSQLIDKQIELQISNNGITSVKGCVLRVFPPRFIPAERMAASSLSRSTTFDVIDDVFYMNVPELEPGEVFTATLEKRSGIPLSAATKKFFANLFKVSIYLFFAFLIALVWWFIRKKRKSVNILDPDGNLRNEDTSNHYSIYDEKEKLESATGNVNSVNVPKSTERPAKTIKSKPTPVRIKRVKLNEAQDSEPISGKKRIETKQSSIVSAAPVAGTRVAPTRVAPTRVAPTRVAPTRVAPTRVAPTPVAPVPVAP